MGSKVLGGETSLKESPNVKFERRGVYSNFPAVTPKYNQRALNDAGVEHQARLYIPIQEDWGDYIKAIETFDPAAVKFVKELSGKQALTQTPEGGLGYVDFFLESIQETYQEKSQINEVLSDNYVAYFFGQRPPVFNCSGKLLNTRQDDWSVAFSIVYQAALRGTRMAATQTFATLRYDTRIIQGVLLNFNQTLVSTNQNFTQFNFQFLVKKMIVKHQTFRNPTKLVVPEYLLGVLEAADSLGAFLEKNAANERHALSMAFAISAIPGVVT